MKTKKRIGFIAMSGVRAHNPELNELGLTLPGFVERNKVIASLPSLGLLTLAGMTPLEHYEVSYHEVADFREPHELPMEFDLVAISTFSAQVYEAFAVADVYKAQGIPVVMGGLHISCTPDEGLEHADSVVIGEGELSWPRLLKDLEAGELKKVYMPKPGEEFDLANAPMPRFDLLDPERYNRITVQTSRGCPHRCSFCASSVLLTPKYKLKPVDKVIEEIHAIKRIWSHPFIEFADDNSFVHREHYKELLRRLIPEKLRWFTEADISIADDHELLNLMREAGCQQVLIGLESPGTDSLEGVEIRSNWKRQKRQCYSEAINCIQDHGITVNGCFILGLDGDSSAVFDETLDFVRASELYEVQVTYLTAFPGTPLYRQMKKDNRLLHPCDWSRCTLFDLSVRPQGMSQEELQSGFLRLVKTLYSEDETQSRRRKFRQRLKRYASRVAKAA